MGNSRIYSGLVKTAPFEGYGGRIVVRSLPADLAREWVASFLPSALVSGVGLTGGVWDAALPEGVPDDVATSFTHGVLAEPPVSEWPPFDPDDFGPEMSERMASSMGCTPADLVVVPKASLVLFAADAVVDHLASSPSAVALVVEMNQQVDQAPVVWRSAMGVLYPASGSSLDRDAIADLMDMAADASSELVILTSTDRLDPSRSLSITDEDLMDLCSRAAGLLIGAYDGEGYVRWSRTVQQAHQPDAQ